MQAIDLVKPEARTSYEEWERWLNWTQSRLRTMPFAKRKIIEVKQDDGYIRKPLPTDEELLAAPTLDEEDGQEAEDTY